jgi:hypothetical protein
MAKEGAALTIKAVVSIVILTSSVLGGASWAINKYIFTQAQTNQVTSKQIESLRQEVTIVSQNQLCIYNRLDTLDIISNEIKRQGNAINGLNKVTRCILKATVTSRDTLITLWEQLPPLFAEKKNDRTYPILLNANLVSIP